MLPRDVPTYGPGAVALLSVTAFVCLGLGAMLLGRGAFVAVLVAVICLRLFARRAWGWLASRLNDAAYQRGYDCGHARGWSEGYATAWPLGCAAGEARMARANALNTLTPEAREHAAMRRAVEAKHARRVQWGGRLARLNEPPPRGFNDGEGEE